jgi:CheY-like chemotaxis protein
MLIAEDNEDDALFLRWALTKAGLGKSAVFVRDGEEAVKYLNREPPFDDPVLCPKPGLVLLDGRMPKMDGLDVLLWLSRHPEVGQLRVLLFTSALTPEQRLRAVELGAAACVDKPSESVGWSNLAEQLRTLSNAPPGC